MKLRRQGRNRFSIFLLLAIGIFTLPSRAATVTVTSTADAGGTCPGTDCTLRQAIIAAAPNDTINFAAGITTITLTSAELLINKNLTINGPGANLLTVERSATAGNFRIFLISPSSVIATISGLTIANGIAIGGGGIFNIGTVALTNSTISGNNASGGTGGGGIQNGGGTLTITNSTISGNTAGGGTGGGGIFNIAGGIVTIINSTISGNTTIGAGASGGAIFNGGPLTIINSTIADNEAVVEGGGIFNNFVSTVNARNTIIALNSAPTGPDFSGTLTSQGYNLISNTSGTVITGDTTGNQLNINPMLGALQNNGGPTFTHALLSGSTAIDRGHSSGSTTDQRGSIRPSGNPAVPSSDGSDIGAFEIEVCITMLTRVNLAPITINDCPIFCSAPEPASPYPSTITVAGLPGTITKVTAKLKNFAHNFPDDVDVLLVGPFGQNATIMSDVGGGTDASGVTLTLDDSAGGSLPDAGALTTGTFKPTNIGFGDTFPGQGSSGVSLLSTFNGTNPNGLWRLYIVDDATVDSGILSGGWEITITTNGTCPTPTSTNTPTSTATNTNTPTDTPTDTPTPSGSPSISGTVTYVNASAPPKFISNVLISGAGSPNVSTTTLLPGAGAGTYSLTGFGAGSYTVTPTKTTGGVNGISSFDAGKIAQHVAGVPPLLNATQLIAADASGNNAVTSFDAGQIARFVTSSPPFGISGTWRFFTPNPTFPVGASPTSRTYPSVTSNITGEDYVGILVGEVSGNWNPSTAPIRPAGGPVVEGSRQLAGGSGPERGVAVELPQTGAAVGKEIVLPVSVHGVADKEIISYEFDLRYDQSVIQPLPSPVDVAGTVSRGLSVVTNATEPGLLRVVVYGAMPIDENGLLLNLRFTAVGVAGSVSSLTWERMMFNEGEPRVMAVDGLVELSKW